MQECNSEMQKMQMAIIIENIKSKHHKTDITPEKSESKWKNKPGSN